MLRALAAVVLVAALLPERARAVACESDEALTHAAAELIAAGGPLSPYVLARAARDAGSDAPVVHALRDVDGDDARVASWVTALRLRADAPLVCGEAWGEHGRLVLAAARAGTLAIDADDPALLRGTLAPGFSAPELVAHGADGALVRLGVTPHELATGIALAHLVELPARIQLLATGPHGPTPIAERTLPNPGRGAGTRSQRALPSPGLGAGTWSQRTPPEGRIGARVAELREAHGASELRANRLLEREAAAHAERVCAEGRVAHTLEPGEDPETRLARHRIRARVVGEVVARASSPAAAMDALRESPSHRYTLADRRFTDVGIGLARDSRGRTCLVVLLASWPRYAP